MAIATPESSKEQRRAPHLPDTELQLQDHKGRYVGHAWLVSPENIPYIDGTKLQVKGRTVTLQQDESPHAAREAVHSEPQHSVSSAMANANLTHLESQLEASLARLRERQDADAVWTKDMVARIERQAEQAEARFEKTSQGLFEQHQELKRTIDTRFEESRRHSTIVALSTVGGVFAGFAIVIALAVGWMTEQGSYAKSYGEAQVQIQQAADERAEFREAVKAIHATQQSILERLPQSQPPAD